MEQEKAKEDATLTVPPGFVPYLRTGLFNEWGRSAEDIADLALRFGSRVPDGIYGAPLQKFDTIRVLLGEIGCKDSAHGDIAINLSVGGVYVVEGLKGQHLTLVDQLDEMPDATRKTMRDAASAKVAEFGEFVKAVEEQARRVGGGLPSSSPTGPTRRSPLESRSPRVRRPQP
jgi:hypothetical protein